MNIGFTYFILELILLDYFKKFVEICSTVDFPIDQVIIELKRVAGSLDNIFVVTVDKKSLSAYYYYEDNYKSTNIIYAPPKYKDLTFVRL